MRSRISRAKSKGFQKGTSPRTQTASKNASPPARRRRKSTEGAPGQQKKNAIVDPKERHQGLKEKLHPHPASPQLPTPKPPPALNRQSPYRFAQPIANNFCPGEHSVHFSRQASKERRLAALGLYIAYAPRTYIGLCIANA